MSKKIKGLRDGTGPYEDSWQRIKRTSGRRIEAGEECPLKDGSLKIKKGGMFFK